MNAELTHRLHAADAVCALRRALDAVKRGADSAAMVLAVDAVIALADAHLLTDFRAGIAVIYSRRDSRDGSARRLTVRREKMGAKPHQGRPAARNGRARTRAMGVSA